MAGGTVTLQIIGDAKGALKVVENFSGQVKKELGAISAPASTTQQRLDAMGKVGTVAFKAILTGAVAAGTAIAASLKSGIDYADQIQQVSQKTGIAAESLSGLQYAAGLADVSMNSLSSALGKLAKAQVGNLEQFKAIGVETRNLDGSMRDTEAVLLDVADVFQKMPDGAEKSKLAMDLFGKAGRDMIPMLNEGSAGIRAATEEAKAFGLVVSQETAEAADKFNDNLYRLSGVAKGFNATLAAELAPSLAALTDLFIEGAKEGEGMQGAARRLGDTIRTVAGVFIAGTAQVQKFSEALAFVVDVGGQVVDALSGISDAVILGARAAVAFTQGQYDLGNKLYAMSKDAGAKVTKGLSDGIKASLRNLNEGWQAIDETAMRRIQAVWTVATETSAKAGDAADEAGKKTNHYAAALEAARRAAEGAEPAVAKLNRAVGAQIEVMGSATEQWKYAVEDLDQELIPFFTDFDVGVVEAGERYAEFSGVVDEHSAMISDVIGQMIEEVIYDWENMGDSLERIAQNFLSNLVRRFSSTVLPLNVQGGGGGFNTSALYGGQNSLFGGQGFSWGQAGSAAMYGYGAYQAGQAGNMGGAVLGGAASGAQIGTMIMPGIGTAVGAIIGAIAGYFMTNTDIPALNVIGDDVVGTSGYRNLAPGSSYESRLGGFTFASIDGVDRAQRDQIGGAITDFDNTIASFLDDEQLARVTAALSTFNLHLEEGAITAENIIGQRWDAILNTFPEDIQAIVRGAGDLADQVQKLGEVLQFPKLIEDILAGFGEADLLATMTDMERATYAVNKQFDDAKAALVAMGATEAQLAEIETYRANALERLAQLQQDQLDALLDPLWFDELTEGMTPSEREIARINKYYDDLKEQAIALGATQEELALIERRRNAALSDAIPILEQTVDVLEELPNVLSGLDQLHDDSSDGLDDWRRAMQQVRDFLNGERYSATSTLTPEQMLRAAQGDFADLLSRAQGGDSAAAGGLAAAAQRLLDLGRSYYASGDEYDALRNSVLGSLSPFGNLANNPSSQLHDAMNALRTAFVQFGQYLQEWNNRNYPPGSAANGANYAGGESAMVGELRAVVAEVKELRKAVSAQGDKQASAIREGLKRGVA